jgi:hypothetical protein
MFGVYVSRLFGTYVLARVYGTLKHRTVAQYYVIQKLSRNMNNKRPLAQPSKGSELPRQMILAERLGIEEHLDSRFIDVVSIEHFGW